MATSKILLGPIPHARYDWVSGASYGKEAIVFHKGSSYIALSNNPSTEPSFTYDPATGSYNVSAGSSFSWASTPTVPPSPSR